MVGGSGLRAMDKTGSSDPYTEVFVWCPTTLTLPLNPLTLTLTLALTLTLTL